MANLKKDFPIFENNPGLVFLDSTASSQKPAYVIDGISNFLSNDYSNIHRGSYSLAERSEELYIKSKQKLAKFLNADSWREIIYTFNANYAFNLLAQNLRKSNFLKKGDKILVSITEHHANIVPWMILKDEIGIDLEFIEINDDFSLNLEDLEKKLDKKVKVISLTQVSNVTGQIFDLEAVSKIIGNFKKKNKSDFPLFIADITQSFPHFEVDVKKLQLDFAIFTGHKFMADSGIGGFWGKTEILEKLIPCFSGGGAISSVNVNGYKDNSTLPEKFEIGTPNISGAVSILKALEYIEQIGGYKEIEKIENELVSYCIKKWKDFSKKYDFKFFGNLSEKNRVGVFSFSFSHIHSFDISDNLAQNNICIRAGQHCAEPFLQSQNYNHSCRMSLYIYNEKSDIDKFFEALEKAVNELSF